MAQKEAYTWHFGFNGGVNFNFTPPLPITGFTAAREGGAVMCDKNTGQLLFSTEGMSVWNRNGVVMPNGTGLLGDTSSTQSAIAIPKPGSTNRYYLFTTALLKGLCYSEIDMALAGGNGDVVAATKNTLLLSASESSEKLIAVRHCNGVDYWVITHRLFSNSFVVYLVNAAGVQPGVSYNIGAVLGDANGWTGVGYLKLSSSGQRLAHAIGPASSGQLSNVELLNFDDKTGVISGPVIQLTGFNFPYGVEFSPTGRFLYVSETLGKGISQYDLGAANINASKTLVVGLPQRNFGALQLAPDGKIYVATGNGLNASYSFLDCIKNPEGLGHACYYQPNAIDLNPHEAFLGLPTLAAHYLLRDSSFISNPPFCVGISGVFSFTSTGNVDSVKWNFGDASPVSNQTAPSHTYASPGTYQVQLILYKSCNRNDTIRKPVMVTNCTDNCNNNWLFTPTSGSRVTVGDLDVAGNQLTVEAMFNCIPPFFVGFYGQLVSKGATSNTNYALYPDRCDITTDAGHFFMRTCPLEKNKSHHVAMVYDGAMLKFYRNGFLLNQRACSGNLNNNDLLTTIGQWAFAPTLTGSQFFGYINEVRIWNLARTQSQIRSFMNSPLPNPTTQPGLLGYYTFDNLQNKQGNAAFNGTLQGGAAINATNPNCTFIADSCRVNASIGNIINAYTPVLGLSPCDNKLTVEDATAFKVGDTVLLIQMKGAVIDSSNTANFGTVTNNRSAGNYEFNYVQSKVGNVIELRNLIVRSYEIPQGKVQLVRVPYYDNATVSSTLTCLPWDGSKGGVLAFLVADTLKLGANIDVSGKGFRGGNTFTIGPAVTSCFQDGYFYDSSSVANARKGEGIADVGPGKLNGRGPLANGGGGGNGHNAGGGGGSNNGMGGFGGYQLIECNFGNYDNRGIAGRQVLYGNPFNKVYLGGGGGAGHKDGLPTDFASSRGGNGGGIVLVKADKLVSNGFAITANGANGNQCDVNGFTCLHDGMGGGGAGGTIAMDIANYVGNSTVRATGGKGADLTVYSVAAGRVGPGGGGGGGSLWVGQSSLPVGMNVQLNGGNSGVIPLFGNNSLGATNGLAGIPLFNLVMPITAPPFAKNIDSVRIKDSLTACLAYQFKGLAFTRSAAIAQWQWFFGDGGTANTQNTAHTYATVGNYTVKLVVTDVNGCKDSIARIISVTLAAAANAGNDTAFCSNGPVSANLQASGGVNYSWAPAALLNNGNVANPVATIAATTQFYVTVITAEGCTAVDSVRITVNALPQVRANRDTAICRSAPFTLLATGAGSYAWSPASAVGNASAGSTSFVGGQSQQLIVVGTDAAGCQASDTVNITVNALPTVIATNDTILCSGQSLVLSATGAPAYQWTPSVFLSNPNISNPVFTGNTSQVYVVTGTDANGCQGTDTVGIQLRSVANLQAPLNKSLCRGDNVVLNGANGSAFQYVWSPATGLSNPLAENPVCGTTVTTPYTVTISEPICNVQRSFPVLVTVNPLPTVAATTSNPIDCALPFSNLQATGALQYNWLPATGLNNPAIANPVANPTGTTVYAVTGTDANGCKGSASVEVKVLAGGNNFTEMPNAFTPNGDGRNDCYGPGRFWRNIVSMELTIFNRWGQRVFYSTNPANCWDGTYKGVNAEANTYVYHLKVKTACGQVEKKGHVVLIR
jgi:gliding motility-associated-like protein